jgi:hypothetical protein
MRGERVKRTKWRDKKSERDDGEKKFQRYIRSERHMDKNLEIKESDQHFRKNKTNKCY